MASQQQEQEAGDATNFVLIFAGALLENAEALIRMVSSSLFSSLLVLRVCVIHRDEVSERWKIVGMWEL